MFFRSSDRKLLEKIVAQIDDLTAALAKATADTQTLIADVATEVKNLQAQIAALQASGTPVDLTAVIASVNALDTLVKGADPGTPAPTTP